MFEDHVDVLISSRAELSEIFDDPFPSRHLRYKNILAKFQLFIYDSYEI